jgi:hypothetical protein
MLEWCLVLGAAYVMGMLLWTYTARAIARERYGPDKD